jgi:hypothetical protein
MREYLVAVGCPVCDAQSTFVEPTDGPVALDLDVSATAEHCPVCRAHVPAHGGWDLHETVRIQRVPEDSSARSDGGVGGVDASVAPHDTGTDRALSDRHVSAALEAGQVSRFETHRRDFCSDAAAVRHLLAVGMAAREAGAAMAGEDGGGVMPDGTVHAPYPDRPTRPARPPDREWRVRPPE